MHRITELHWRADRVEHIARHNVTPEEFEEALFDDEHGLLSGGEAARRDPQEALNRYLGRTRAGRYLFLVVIYMGEGVADPMSAREMTRTERRRYSR